MTEEEYWNFIHQSYEYLKSQQDILFSEYGVGTFERWDYDLETGEFVFSDSGVPKLFADFQVVGSISTISNTWLWSWANPGINDSVKKEIFLVKEFGEKQGLRQLTQEKWEAYEVDGWAMTNISAKLLKAKGAYRCPVEIGYLFLIFTDVWTAPPA